MHQRQTLTGSLIRGYDVHFSPVDEGNAQMAHWWVNPQMDMASRGAAPDTCMNNETYDVARRSNEQNTTSKSVITWARSGRATMAYCAHA